MKRIYYLPQLLKSAETVQLAFDHLKIFKYRGKGEADRHYFAGLSERGYP